MRFLFKKSVPFFLFYPRRATFGATFVWKFFAVTRFEVQALPVLIIGWFILCSLRFYKNWLCRYYGSETRSIIYSLLKPREYTPIYHELFSLLSPNHSSIFFLFFVFRRLKSKRKRALIPLDWPFKLKRRTETGSF